jgi:deoxyuridine 5'-triphosphate nucleotidohydrolase
MEIKIKKLHPDAILPTYATEGSAGFDLCYAGKDVTMESQSIYCLTTGLSFEIPQGYEMQVRSRSGLAVKHAITVLNSPGTIDSDFRGEVKVILENAYLTKEEIVKACQLCEEAGADYVKSSTGFAPTGAILEDILLMRSAVSSKIEVKSAGGVKSLDMLLAFMDAGVKRSGASGTAAMLDEFKERFGS